MTELDLISWLRKRAPINTETVSVGVGDDAAVLAWLGGERLVITTDMLLEGTCFLPEHGWRRIGRKALAVNLSDLAAMAAEPVAAVVSLAIPRTMSLEAVKECYEGMFSLADEFSVAIVGGDTNSWNGPLAINVTACGRVNGQGPILRRGAQAGDWLLVTGSLGGSILGKHLDFVPRIREARRLVQTVRVHAMIDLSDGLARDLHQLCRESHCGAVIYADQVPISAEAKMIQDGRPPLLHALSDGEDFELLFAVSPEEGVKLLREQPLQDLGTTLYHIGTCTRDGVYIRYEDGREENLPPLGYLHEFG